MSDKKKILIVEDEKALSRVLGLKLENAGYVVERAFNGQEALAFLEKDDFSLIILDLMMSKMNGFDVLAQLKDLKNEIPVIVASNLSQEEDLKKAKNLGAADYFVKSDSTLDEIVDYVNKFLK